MSEQALDLRRSVQIVRRHKIIVGIGVLLGILGSVGYTVRYPPMLAAKALVVLPPSASRFVGTQVVIAGSDPVLAGAMRQVNPPLSLTTLRDRVRVTSLTSGIVSISAEGGTAIQAEDTANAVANSYVAYVSSPKIPGGPVQARVLERATDATGTPLSIRLLITGGLGALAGLLIGAIAALAIGRGDRRLWQRDEIAESIGVPVLASIATGRPSGAAGWKKLIEEYEPEVVDAWRLRQALQRLGQELVQADSNGSGYSLTVLSLSSDRKALALGPHLAVFAASLGTPTALVIGPQQDANATATLRAACAAAPPSSRRSSNLQVAVADHGKLDLRPDAMLTVVVAVVDSQTPRVDDMMYTRATVLGVSAGATTAGQLARVAASAAAGGRHLSGILVADPDPADHTTGRLPRLARRPRRTRPAHITTKATETRR